MRETIYRVAVIPGDGIGKEVVPSAQGVSSATTSTVVVTSVAILVSDYFITAFWGFQI